MVWECSKTVTKGVLSQLFVFQSAPVVKAWTEDLYRNMTDCVTRLD